MNQFAAPAAVGRLTLPTEYWIELTSTCPFDCVFCSRKTLRGKGQHLNFVTYEKLIRQVGHPRVIRLNYAGESMHYPQLVEAVRLAVATGARVEMVTALASARSDLLAALLGTGLHELCVSVHSLDAAMFSEIYGYGDLKKMLQCLDQVSTFAARNANFCFEIAFVAMARNIHELPAVAALAERLGARRMVVHPVIRRDEIPELFADERDNGQLTDVFRHALREQIELTKVGVQVPIALSSAELDAEVALPQAGTIDFSGPLPAGARIVSCYQSPFDTVHVLANGDVVTCEVRDRIPLGNLNRESFFEIWNGLSYRQFRNGFAAGLDNHCRNCAYKMVQMPTGLACNSVPAQSKPIQPIAAKKAWRQRLRLLPLSLGISAVDLIGKISRLRTPAIALHRATRPGLSVLVPEYDNLTELGDTLEALAIALGGITEPVEVIIVVNGSPAANYVDLADRFSSFCWFYVSRALGYGGAIRRGLNSVRYDWVYLLNSDMRLAPTALTTAMAAREDGVFAIASQIFFKDASKRREETGWTDVVFEDGELQIYDREPDHQLLMRGNVYAGGGSSLFRTEPLRQYANRSHCYDPFYWEDADWGLAAIRDGWEIFFCPQSVGWHGHRSTIGRHFERAEIDAVVARNAALFEVRQRVAGQTKAQLIERIKALPYREQRRSLRLSVLPEILVQRLRSWRHQIPIEEIVNVNACYRVPCVDGSRPKLIVVAPFCVFPPSHGGARRIAEMVLRAQAQFEVVLLSDERSRYTLEAQPWIEKLYAVYLIEGRVAATSNENWAVRAENHCHPGLQRALLRLIQIHQPVAVQIEHLELAPLIRLRAKTDLKAPWILDLHDAESSETLGALTEAVELYDARIVTSDEDGALLGGDRAWTLVNGFPTVTGPLAPSPPNGYVLFVGALRYAPNLSGLFEFLLEAWPRIRAALPVLELIVIGGQGATELARRMPPAKRDGVRVVEGYHDPAVFYANAALTINPQSNIRGSALKVVESLAAGRICVSLDDGVRGYRDIRTAALQVVNDSPAMATRIIELITDVERRHRLEVDRHETLASLSWDCVAAEWIRKVATLVQKHDR